MKNFFFIFLILLFFTNCEQNKNSNLNDEDEVKIYLCFPIESSGEMRYYKGYKFDQPLFLKSQLDTLILIEKKHPCYRESYAGFIVFFKPLVNDIGEIFITTTNNIYIRDYTGSKGYFEYKSHFFICYGDISDYPISPIRNIRINIAVPKVSSAYIDDSNFSWTYVYNKGMIFPK